MTHRNVYMTDELEAIYDHTVEFVSKEVTPHADQWELDGKVPRDVLKQMGALGMLGLRVPEEFGGLGLGMLVPLAPRPGRCAGTKRCESVPHAPLPQSHRGH